MYITVNFILLFLIVILPGIVFRRFYFYGDFSKQFRIKEPLHHLFISNIIPGVILLIFSLLILGQLEWISHLKDLYPQVRHSLIESFHPELPIKDDFLEDVSKIALTTFLLAFLTGYFISRTIRLFRLDIRYKLLRYRNGWYYLFSGEISNFEKFKKNLNLKNELRKKKLFYPPLVDILIGQGSKKLLYSGVLLDYEVSQDNLLRLERVYLKNAKRYSNRDGKVVAVDIPGDLFLLNTTNLLNININYPKVSGLEHTAKKEENKKKREKAFFIYKMFLGIITILIFLIFPISLFVNLGWPVYDSQRWYQKTILIITVLQFLSLLFPKAKQSDKNLEKQKPEPNPNKIRHFLWLLLWLSIYLLIYWFSK